MQAHKDNVCYDVLGRVGDQQRSGSHTSQHSAADVAVSETCRREPEGSRRALHFNTEW